MIVISVIITSSPNGSSGVTLMEGGGERLGVCAGASDRAKPITKAAARGSRKIREMTIEISPRGTGSWAAAPLRRVDLSTVVIHDRTSDWPLNRCNLITGNISARSRHGCFIQSSLCEDERPRQRDRRGGHAREAAGHYRRGGTRGRCSRAI